MDGLDMVNSAVTAINACVQVVVADLQELRQRREQDQARAVAAPQSETEAQRAHLHAAAERQ